MTDEPAAPPPQNLPAVRKFEVVQNDTALFDTAKFEQIARVATAHFEASFLPVALTTVQVGENKVELGPKAILANCLIVSSLAHDWGTSFMAVAQCISIVHGKPMFEGKLIAAVIERRLGFRLRYEYSGEPGTDSYGVKVFTDRDAAEGYNPIEGTVGEWATKERGGARKSIWVGANRQKLQLAYMGARVWARLNSPGLILGVVGSDEVDDMDVITHQPAPPPATLSGGFRTTTAAPAPEVAYRDADRELALRHAGAGEEESELALKWLYGQGHSLSALDKDADWTWYLAAYRDRKKPEPIGKAMSHALLIARGQIDELVGQLSPHMGETVPENWLFQPSPTPFPETADEGQALLGRMNRWIDRAKVILADHAKAALAPKAAAAPAEAAGEDGEEEPSTSPPPPPPPPPLPPAPPPPTFEVVLNSLLTTLRPSKTWEGLKATLSGFAKNPEWKRMTSDDKSRVYREIWALADKLNAAKLAGPDNCMEVHPDTDITAYRCALEACDDRGMVQAMWSQMLDADPWRQASPANQRALTDATAARLELLK